MPHLGVKSVATRHRSPCPVKENKWAYEATMAPRLKKFETRKWEWSNFKENIYFLLFKEQCKIRRSSSKVPNEFSNIIKKDNIQQRVHLSFRQQPLTRSCMFCKMLCSNLREIIKHQKLWPKAIYRYGIYLNKIYPIKG